MARFIACLFLFAHLSPLAIGQPADLLPKGAIARLGTGRFRPPGGVEALALSPDGKLLASGSHREVTLWDFATGSKVACFPATYSHVVAFMDNGRTLVSVDGTATLRYRDVASGKVVHQKNLVPDEKYWDSAFITPNGHFLAFLGNDGAHVWDLADRKEIKHIKLADLNMPVAVSSDGKQLALHNGGIEVWDIASARRVRTLTSDEPAYLRRFGFSPDDKTLVSMGSHHHGTRSWDLRSGAVRAKYGAVKPETRAFAYSSDGKLLATVGFVWDDKKEYIHSVIRVWDAATDRELRHWRIKNWSINALHFTPDGKTLISGASEPIIRRWDMATGKEIAKDEGGEGRPERIFASPDGRRLIVSSRWPDRPRLWDVKSRRPITELSDTSGYPEVAAFAPDSKQFAYAHADRSVRLCDAATGKELRKFDRHEDDTGQFERREKVVTSLTFSADGETLLVAHADLTLRARRVADGKVMLDRILEPRIKVGMQMHEHAFSRDGRVWLDREHGRAYETATGRLLASVNQRLDQALSPDGRTLAVTRADGSLVIHDVATNKIRLIIPRKKPREQYLRSFGPLALSPDGKFLAALPINSDGIEIFDTTTGRRVKAIDDVQGGIAAMTFIGNDVLATGGQDTTILLWDLRSSP